MLWIWGDAEDALGELFEKSFPQTPSKTFYIWGSNCREVTLNFCLQKFSLLRQQTSNSIEPSRERTFKFNVSLSENNICRGRYTLSSHFPRQKISADDFQVRANARALTEGVSPHPT